MVRVRVRVRVMVRARGTAHHLEALVGLVDAQLV